MSYIQAIGVYVPRLRLSRASMATALGWLTPGAGAGGKGHRAMAYWDEDSITLAVAAARYALSQVPTAEVSSLHFSSTTPPFFQPQNAAFIRAALRLRTDMPTHDVHGSPRASLLALQQALDAGGTALIAAGDVPDAVAGSAAEAHAGDGGAAVLTGSQSGILRYLGGASISEPFIDSYRPADTGTTQGWEERWVRDEGYMKLVHKAMMKALDVSGLAASDIDHFVMPSTLRGVGQALADKGGFTKASVCPTLSDVCGDTGTAHAFIMLAHALEQARPGQKILLTQLGQGATALLFEATDQLDQARPSVSCQLEHGVEESNYMKLLAFRGKIDWERGLRGRFTVNEALSTSWRYSEALLGFVGGRCRQTGRIQFPPSMLDGGAGSHTDTQEPVSLADRVGRVVTCTADRLAFSPCPPSCYGLVDIDGGARLLMEYTDPQASQLSPGASVEFTFRIKDLDANTGFRRYFWKAIPAIQAVRG